MRRKSNHYNNEINIPIIQPGIVLAYFDKRIALVSTLEKIGGLAIWKIIPDLVTVTVHAPL